MLTIRLMRFGRRHQPFFRLVVVPKRGKPDRGKYIEMLGWVNPVKHERKIEGERVRYWMSQGAQPSPTAWNLFVTEGIVEGAKKPKHKKIEAKTETVETSAPQGKAAEEIPTKEAGEASEGGEETEPELAIEEAVEIPPEEGPSEEKTDEEAQS